MNGLNLVTEISHRKYDKIFTDASSKSYGIYFIFRDGVRLVFSGDFSFKDSILSINVKEYFALVLAVFLACQWDAEKHVFGNYLVFTDNTCAQMLSISKKARLKNKTISKLTEVLSKLQFSYESVFSMHRIDTANNIHADFLSRNTARFPSSVLLGLSISDLTNLL